MNADLEIISSVDLQLISDSIAEEAFELHCGRNSDSTYLARYEIDNETNYDKPIELIKDFCGLIERLPPPSMQLWKEATSKVIDLGFRTDEKSNAIWCQIPLDVSKRMLALDIQLMVTIYPLEEDSFG